MDAISLDSSLNESSSKFLQMFSADNNSNKDSTNVKK